MSLVNDMLTDLDSRDENDLEKIVLIDRQTGKQSQREVKGPTLYLFLAFLLGAIGIWVGVQWQNRDNSIERDFSNLALLESLSTDKKVLLDKGSIDRPATKIPGLNVLVGESLFSLPNFGQSKPLELVHDIQNIENEITTSLVDGNNFPINNNSKTDDSVTITQNLLQKAELAFTANKLTRPVGDNAFSLYQKILYSSPNNFQARLGIRKIAERYISMADDLYLQGEWDRAKHYDNKARFVAGFYPEIEAWLAGVNRPQTNQAKLGSFQNGLSDVENNQDKNNLAGSAKDTPSTENHAVQLPSQPLAELGSESSIKVERSKEADKENRIRKVRSLLAQAELNLAEAELLDAALAFPKSVEIKRLLFDVYVDSNRQMMARKILATMTGLAAHDLAFLESRVLVSESKSLAAIKLLEKFTPNVYDASDFYRLLAALYQNQGRYTESANQYRKLISFDDKQATYWLGLAVSLDALSDEQGALQAFQWVRQYGIADREARAYVDQRIRSLSS